MIGTITKALSGFYYVVPEGGADRAYQCRARGVFKKEGISPLVGDLADISLTDDDEVEGVIERILPRKNEFIRPPVANIELFAIVIAVRDPSPNMEILDRFLVTAEAQYTDTLICVNKCDLGSSRRIKDIYSSIYPVVSLSAFTGEGMDELKEGLRGRRAAFAGPSGVGKSSLINRLTGGIDAQTGRVSEKTGRGRHTTRHIEIIETDFGAQLYDTPGYTSFDPAQSDRRELALLFPEMSALAGSCRFDDCMHLSEPDCAIREALSKGQIAPSRYRSYERMVKEMGSNTKNKGAKCFS